MCSCYEAEKKHMLLWLLNRDHIYFPVRKMVFLQKTVVEISRGRKGMLGRQCAGLGWGTLRGAVTVFPRYCKQTYLAV